LTNETAGEVKLEQNENIWNIVREIRSLIRSSDRRSITCNCRPRY
jgi:hypothetical protein